MDKAKVLVVEDEGIVAAVIKDTVINLGYDVPAVVFTGEEAVKKAEALRPDLVLMDIGLKGAMDGIQAAEEILKRFNIPVIYLTAYADKKTLQRAKITEPFGYILKPFEERELHTNIEIALYKYKVEQERKKLEVQLYQSHKMAAIGKLAAGVAHEINNPATFVKVNAVTMAKWWKLLGPIYSKVLESGWDREPGLEKLSDMLPKFSKMIQAIEKGVKRISSITSALREFARSDHQEKQLVDIRRVVESAVMVTENQYKHHADLVNKNGFEIPKIVGNSHKLEQVFVNLIINAADATKEKVEIMRDRGESFQGLISISTSLQGTKAERINMVVKDNGIGMDTAGMQKVSDPFFTTKSVGKGTGLGLSIVYGIIEDHGGDISVDSTKGEETTFTITLPCNQNLRQNV